jgi:hypothetical protein
MENPRQPDIDVVRETLRQRDERAMDPDEEEGAEVAEVDEEQAEDPDDQG